MSGIWNLLEAKYTPLPPFSKDGPSPPLPPLPRIKGVGIAEREICRLPSKLGGSGQRNEKAPIREPHTLDARLLSTHGRSITQTQPTTTNSQRTHAISGAAHQEA